MDNESVTQRGNWCAIYTTMISNTNFLEHFAIYFKLSSVYSYNIIINVWEKGECVEQG